jgi:hypothetical protein
MTDLNYKKYSLQQLENWIHDTLSAGEASAEEVYNTIKKVVQEQYYHHKHYTGQAYELLALLNGNGIGHIEAYDAVMREREYYEGCPDVDKILSCDKDDPSPECKGAWNSFWEDSMPPWGHSDLEYCIREAEYYRKEDKVVKWQLPVEVDGLSGDCFINFPDDLLEAANLKEGDMIEWVDNGDGSYTMRKVNGIE